MMLVTSSGSSKIFPIRPEVLLLLCCSAPLADELMAALKNRTRSCKPCSMSLHHEKSSLTLQCGTLHRSHAHFQVANR